jgi:hypothetical protein
MRRARTPRTSGKKRYLGGMTRAAERTCVLVAWTIVGVGMACVGDDPDAVSAPAVDGGALDAPAPGIEAAASPGDAEADSPGHCTGMFGTPEPLAGGVNTPNNHEYPGRLSRDGLTLYFARVPVGGQGIDLFLSTRTADGGFDVGTRLTNLDSPASETEPSVGDDGGLIVFGSSRDGGPGNVDLYSAKWTGTDFGVPTLIPGLSRPGNDFQPYLANNGAALYFTRVETNGDYQIYVSRRNGDGSFSAPEKVKGEINTEDVEGNPVLTDDELTIYFKRAPKGHTGPSNILRATRSAVADPFGNPTQVMELNTFADDAPGWVAPDECTILMTSRAAGSFDLLVARRSR